MHHTEFIQIFCMISNCCTISSEIILTYSLQTQIYSILRFFLENFSTELNLDNFDCFFYSVEITQLIHNQSTIM